MGWRERDWAKFTKDEFEAIYGPSTPASYTTGAGRGRAPSRRGSGSLRALGLLGLAVVATVAILGAMIVTGHVPTTSPGVASPHVSYVPVQTPPLPAIPAVPVQAPSHRVTLITGTRVLQRGGTFTLSGRHTPESGSIGISGKWGSGPWTTFGVADASRSTYSLRIPLTRRGVLHLRISYPDGTRAVGTYQVE